MYLCIHISSALRANPATALGHSFVSSYNSSISSSTRSHWSRSSIVNASTSISIASA